VRDGQYRPGRLVSALVGTAFRADPRRAALTIALSLLASGSTMVVSYWTKLLIDDVLSGDGHGARWAAVAIVASGMLAFGAILSLVQVRFRLQEATGHALELDMVRRISGLARIAHHEDASVLDELELLRSQRSQLSTAVEMAVEMLSSVARFTVTVVLLAQVSPLLLLLVLFGLPGIASVRRWNRRNDQLQASLANKRRRADALADVALSAQAAKELRVFDATEHVRALHDIEWDAVESANRRLWRRQNMSGAATELLFNLGYIGALALTVRRILTGNSGAGDQEHVAGHGATISVQLTTLHVHLGAEQPTI
jgi:ATP-binding cassette subfamily B protein